MSQSQTVTISITLEIHDAEAFVRAAREQATSEGLDDADIDSTYTSDELGRCAIMLLDPGMGPAGSSIIESAVLD